MPFADHEFSEWHLHKFSMLTHNMPACSRCP